MEVGVDGERRCERKRGWEIGGPDNKDAGPCIQAKDVKCHFVIWQVMGNH